MHDTSNHIYSIIIMFNESVRYRCYSYLCNSGRLSSTSMRCMSPGCRRPKFSYKMVQGTTEVYIEGNARATNGFPNAKPVS